MPADDVAGVVCDMAFQLERDDARRRITLIADGLITVDHWAEAAAELIIERVWHYATLYDFTAPRATLPDPSELARIARALADVMTQEGRRGPVAFAVADHWEYEHIRSWVDAVGIRLLPRVEAFRTREDAERWLDSLR